MNTSSKRITASTTLPRRGTSCSVPKCKRRGGDNIRMLRFPRDFDERAAWAKRMGRDDWMPKINSRICSWHFPTDDRKCGPTRFEWDVDPEQTLRLTQKLTRLHKSALGDKGTEQTSEIAYFPEKQDVGCSKCASKTAQIELLETENTRVKTELEDTKNQLKLQLQSSQHSSELNQTVEMLQKENAQTLERLRLAECNSWKLLKQNGILGKCIIRYATVKLCDKNMKNLVRIDLQTFHSLCSILNSRPIKFDRKWHVTRIPFEDQVLIFLMKIQLKLTFQFLSIIYTTTHTTITNVFYSLLNSFESCLTDNLFKEVPGLSFFVINFKEYLKTFPKKSLKKASSLDDDVEPPSKKSKQEQRDLIKAD